jgi:hypothetical protein
MKHATFFYKMLLAGVVLACQNGFAQTPPSNIATALSAPNLKAVKGWYDGWLNKDWNLMTQALGDGFTFSSPVDDHISLQAVKERCWSNAYKIKRVDLEKVVVDGDYVVVIGTGWTNAGQSFRNCDCFQLKNGKIAAYECFFGPGINFPNNAVK